MTHYHFIGIGGTGLSAIAHVLLELGHTISGSDKQRSPQVEELELLGIRVCIGHYPENIIDADFVIRSSAIPDDNPEVVAAFKASIPVYKRSDFLKELTKDKTVIAIAGTHGKTTTTAMLSWALTFSGFDPSFVIGGVSKNLMTNGHAGKSKYFVIEADEYDGMFLGLQPDILVVTNIEHDHPDYFPTPQSYMDAFIQLISLIKSGGTLIVCNDDFAAAKLANYIPTNIQSIKYGKNPDADYFAENIQHKTGCGALFTAHGLNNLVINEIQLQIPGEHNVSNAMAVVAVMHVLGLGEDKIKESLETFQGTGRRFDTIGCINGVTVIDDYAHHPSEIKATLAAARCRYPHSPLWVVWQPHTYSRTKTLLNEFVNAFEDCDHVIVTEIFQSREKAQDFSSMEIVHRMKHPDAKFMGDLNEIVNHLLVNLKNGDILMVLSAGDANQISKQIIDHLKANGNSYA